MMLIAVVLLLSVLGVPNRAQPEQPEEAKFVINDTAFQLLFRRKHNALRSKVAIGTTIDGVKYGPAKNMYRMISDTYLEEAATYELNNDFEAVELGRNYFSTVVDSEVNAEELVEKALDSWKKDRSSLSQMLLAKATVLGCAYKLYDLPSRKDAKAAEVLCTYDQNLNGGEPFEEGKPCDKNSDCTTYGKRSVCRRKQHLCAVKL